MLVAVEADGDGLQTKHNEEDRVLNFVDNFPETIEKVVCDAFPRVPSD